MRGHRAWRWLAVGVLILLVAAALRLVALGQVPPGLYHDEAYHGLDALEVWRGHLPLYFRANNGREPIYIYLVALTLPLVGRSPLAVRLPAFPVGLLTVAATIALGRRLFSRRVGLLAGAVLAITLWHVHLSRVGFRAVLLPLFTALTLWLGALALRTGRRRYGLAAGLVYGLSFYTYLAARFTFLALLLFALLWWGMGGAARRRATWTAIRALLPPALLATAVVLLPLGLYTLAHPQTVLGRPGDVSIFNPTINGGDFWGTLGRHTLRTLGLFFVRGDRIWRHNVPWRPVFDPLLGAAFLVGLGVALGRARRDPAALLLLAWTGTMALPTLLAEDAPHFLRGVGLLPLVAFFPALGLDWLSRRVAVLRPYRLPILLLPLAFGLGSTVYAYFGDYAHQPMTAYWFEDGAEALAGRINRFLGVGWDGERLLHGDEGKRRAYVEPVLWHSWPSVPFLVASSDAVFPKPLPAWPAVGSDPVGYFLWPYGRWQRVWRLLEPQAPTAGPRLLTIVEGPLSQGDRDPEPFTTYLAFLVEPLSAEAQALPPIARFRRGVELVGLETAKVGERLRVRLWWRATEPLDQDYTVFLHYLRDGERIAQGDSPPANGHYPTSLWRPGDLMNDDHWVVLEGLPDPRRDQLRFGLYRPETGEYLDLLDEAGNPAGTYITLPVP